MKGSSEHAPHPAEPVIAAVVRFGHLAVGTEFVSGGRRFKRTGAASDPGGPPNAVGIDSGQPARFDWRFLVGVCGQEPEK